MPRITCLFSSALVLLASFACGKPAPTVTSGPTLSPSRPSPTVTPGPTTRPAPVGLVDVDPSILVRLRYATANNFTGAPLPGYTANRALLRPAAADALRRAQVALSRQGSSLVVLDAYRPVRATLAMVAWARRMHHDELIGPYIATHSEHNLGTAVDVTLADAATGREVDMGVAFDTFSTRSHYPNATGAALANRKRLRDALMSVGFHPYDAEWWHFSIRVPGAVPLDAVIR